MKKIFCLINIEEKGVHALFCRLGFHQWMPEGALFEYCAFCPKERKKKILGES